MAKPTLEYQDQINLLKLRGLLIPNEKLSIQYLAENSYYHLNIYFKHHQRPTGNVDKAGNVELVFTTGTTFEDIIRAHEHDKLLRIFLLEALLPIELKLRTIISYYVGLRKGSDCFYCKDDQALYYCQLNIEKLHQRFDEIVNAGRSNPIIQHHEKNYNGIYPLFVIFELTSFNFLIEYFETLHRSFQNKIAQIYFSLDTAYDLINWMKCLNDLRNICAHQNFLFRRLFNATPVILDPTLLYGSNRLTLYAYSIVLGHLSRKEDYSNYLGELSELGERWGLINQTNHGFGPDWKTRLKSVPNLFRSI
jgi:abortive infection bacteriophage resistance protein